MGSFPEGAVALRRIRTPETIARASGCLHSWRMELAAPPPEGAFRPPPDSVEERIFLRTLKGVRSLEAEGSSAEEALEAARGALREGSPWIHRPWLVRGEIGGRPFLLKRVEGASALGGYAYAPVAWIDVEKPTKRDHVLVLAFAHLLEPELGRPVEAAFLKLRGVPELRELPLAPYRKQLDRVLGNLEWVEERHPETKPLRNRECSGCPWTEGCRKGWIGERHVCLLHGVGVDRAKRLLDAGLSTYDQVAAEGVRELTEMLECDPEVAERVRDQARAWVSGGVLVRSPFPWAKGEVEHFYDVEDYAGVVYLHGLLTRRGEGPPRERQFLARGLEEEREVWHRFLEEVASMPAGPVYTWTEFERRYVAALWERHGGSEEGYRRLVRDLVDLQAVLLNHFALPVTGYGLKEAARSLGFEWRTAGAGGAMAGEWYDAWLTRGDEEALRTLCAYNADDLRATAHVHRILKAASSGDS